MNGKPIICLIDDDGLVRQLARRNLEGEGYEVRAYATADSFFVEFDDSIVDCVVTDLQMPGMSGDRLLHRLREMGSTVSVIVLTGHADVKTAVKMMEDGALTLLEKPYKHEDLVGAAARAVERSRIARGEQQALTAARLGLARLTDDERQVMDYMVKGLPNKTIAMRLDLSLRTVDRRRNAVMTKMGVGSVSELAAIVTRLQGVADTVEKRYDE